MSTDSLAKAGFSPNTRSRLMIPDARSTWVSISWATSKSRWGSIRPSCCSMIFRYSLPILMALRGWFNSWATSEDMPLRLGMRRSISHTVTSSTCSINDGSRIKLPAVAAIIVTIIRKPKTAVGTKCENSRKEKPMQMTRVMETIGRPTLAMVSRSARSLSRSFLNSRRYRIR